MNSHDMSMCAEHLTPGTGPDPETPGTPNPNAAAYQAKLEEIQAIPKGEIKTPCIPVDTYLQEAENLEHWCQQDRAELTAAGLPWALVEDLPFRAGALREAESRWFHKRFTREEAQRRWSELSPTAYDLRDTILHAMRYAFRHQPDLVSRVAAIADGRGHDDMIQDLNDAAVLGREHAEQLQAIGFDPSTLDMAAHKSVELADLLAEATADRETDRAVKTIRDRAYTFLKQAVDEVRACGHYVFWRNQDRLRGYTSEYHRNQYRTKAKSAQAEQAPVEPQTS